MWTRQYRQSRLKYLVLPALTVLTIGYFGYHSVEGSFGLKSDQLRQEQLATLEARLQAYRERRGELENQVKQLRDGTIARDMLDENARRLLGLVRADEVVIRLD